MKEATDTVGATASVFDGHDNEVASLARELGHAYAEQLRFHINHLSETVEQAHGHIREDAADLAARAADIPSVHLTWSELSTIAEQAPEKLLTVWQRVKQEASAELASGHRTAMALKESAGPWDRAQFLAIRDAFIEEWRPRGGIELALIDQMATAHSEYLGWLERLHAERQNRVIRTNILEPTVAQYEPPRITSAEAVEEAAAMAERFQRLFVRAVRTLRDLRRFSPTVVVQNASQVNVAAVQQNLSTSD